MPGIESGALYLVSIYKHNYLKIIKFVWPQKAVIVRPKNNIEHLNLLMLDMNMQDSNYLEVQLLSHTLTKAKLCVSCQCNMSRYHESSRPGEISQLDEPL